MAESNNTTRRGVRRFSTASQVKALKPTAKVYEATDKLRRGLCLRVQPSGTRTWFYRYRETQNGAAYGKLHRIPLGEYPSVSLDDARTARDLWAVTKGRAGEPDPHEKLEAERKEKAVRAAQESDQADANAWTIKRLSKAFVVALRRERKRPRTIQEIERQFRHDVYPIIGELAADTVTADDVRRVLQKIEKRGALRLRNAVRVTLRWLYTWAAEDGPAHLRHHANPVAFIAHKKKGDRPKRQRRAFTETELKALWPRLEAHRGNLYADALSLALLCGTRAEETVSARWPDIDLEAGTWTIPDSITKSHRRHTVFLSEPAIGLLKTRVRDGKWVFALRRSLHGHARIDTLRKKLAEHLEALELDTAPTVHELRHTLCTYVEHRWGAGVRQRVANHAREGLSGVYDHSTYDKEAKDAWKAWGDYLSTLAAGGNVVSMEGRRHG